MKKDTNQISLDKQYGLIGGGTIAVSGILANFLGPMDTSIWSTVLILSVIPLVVGIFLGMIAFRDVGKVRLTLWKIAIFLMGLGISWIIISILKLYG